MWVVIYMAKGIKQAEKLKNAIEYEGLIAKIMPVYKKMSDEENYYKIVVLAVEAEEAREIIMDKM